VFGCAKTASWFIKDQGVEEKGSLIEIKTSEKQTPFTNADWSAKHQTLALDSRCGENICRVSAPATSSQLLYAIVRRKNWKGTSIPTITIV
jgi:hypothetical protein